MGKGCVLPNLAKYIGHFSSVDFYTTALRSEVPVKCLQGFTDKFKVLKSCIGLKPQGWLNDINAPNQPLTGCFCERSMIGPSQVAFKPNQ
jgi:hypothetical protein